MADPSPYPGLFDYQPLSAGGDGSATDPGDVDWIRQPASTPDWLNDAVLRYADFTHPPVLMNLDAGSDPNSVSDALDAAMPAAGEINEKDETSSLPDAEATTVAPPEVDVSDGSAPTLAPPHEVEAPDVTLASGVEHPATLIPPIQDPSGPLFDTEEDAARWALNHLNPLSILLNDELHTVLYKMNGKYGYAKYINAGRTGGRVTLTIPQGAVPVAPIHTHGNYSTVNGVPVDKAHDEYDSDNFSGHDPKAMFPGDPPDRPDADFMQMNRDRHYPKYYLGTPSGMFYSYVPGGQVSVFK